MIFLIATIIADVVGIGLLGKAKGISQPWWLAAGLVCMMAGFVAFSYATKVLPVGIANAIWSGMSIVLLVMVGKVFFNESLNVPQMICVALIVVGAVGLGLMEKT